MTPALPVSPYLLAGVAFLVVASATPLVRRLALRWQLVDRPAARKHHDRPMPLLGGLAMLMGIALPLLVLTPSPRRWFLLLGTASLLALAGLYDDVRKLGVLGKLAVQSVAATGLAAAGVRWFLPGLPPVLVFALTVLWLVGVTNAFNLLDNMDGSAASVAAVAAFGFLLLGRGAASTALLAAALLGATVGFLVYNLPPARIFMGDAGSLPMGLVMAVLGIAVQAASAPSIGWLLPLLVLVVPLFDTTLVVISRLRRRRNPLTTPGQDHLSHRLGRAGLRPGMAVLVQALIGAIGTALALTVAAGATAAGVVAAAVGLVALGAGCWLERRSIRGVPAEVAGEGR